MPATAHITISVQHIFLKFFVTEKFYQTSPRQETRCNRTYPKKFFFNVHCKKEFSGKQETGGIYVFIKNKLEKGKRELRDCQEKGDVL